MVDKIEGVFLLEKDTKSGIGDTEKKAKQKMYCLAKEICNDEIEVRYLDSNDEPSEIIEKIPKEEFIHNFTFQPYYFEQKATAIEKKVNQHCAIAEEHTLRKELHDAENEYRNALGLDEENLQANFGIGNVYLKMGESEKAKEVFKKISRIDAIFEEKNKHFFNECGIQLRKQELYDEAIEYYEKAINLSPDDENLYFNLARPYFAKGNEEKVQELIFKALAINPAFKEGKAFLKYMTKNKGNTEGEEKDQIGTKRR